MRLHWLKHLTARLIGQGAPSSAAPIKSSDIPLQTAAVKVRHKADSNYLVPASREQALAINPAGLRLWRLCDGTRSVEDIVNLSKWRFEESSKQIERDIVAALSQFEHHKVIYRLPDTAPGSSPRSPRRSRPKLYATGFTFQPNWSSNSSRQPTNFLWTGEADEATIPLTVCMGDGIAQGVKLPGRKIAWMVETPAISQMQGVDSFINDNLELVLEAYELILTPDRALCGLDDKFKYHPAGSNLPWIAEKHYRIYPKTKLCSMIASSKQVVEGHLIRQQFASRLAGHLDLFGGACGSPRINSDTSPYDKRQGLVPYMFSIAMENCRTSLYYTEKITDCFATGTVPIYWGSDDIGEIFDRRGIIKLDDDFTIENLNADLYQDMMPYIENNFEIVQKLKGADDSLFEKYIMR